MGLPIALIPNPPDRPLENARTNDPQSPEIRYKFASDGSAQIWTPAVGFGPRQATIRYFDTSIAARNL